MSDLINREAVFDKSLFVKMLQGLKDEIINNSYPIVHGINDHELGMTLYGICQVIDKNIKECLE